MAIITHGEKKTRGSQTDQEFASKLPGATDWPTTLKIFCLFILQINTLETSFALFFYAKIRDTFPTSGSFTDAPKWAPSAFNAFESVSEDYESLCN